MRSRAVIHGTSGAPRPSRVANPSNNGSACAPQNSIVPSAPPSCTDLHARPQLRQPLLVPGQLRRPHRGLEPERHRQAGLAVGAPAHHGVAVAPGQRDARGAAAGDVPFDDVADALQHPAEPRVGEVLHGRAVVHPLARLVRAGSPGGARISPCVECPEARVPSATTARSSRSIVACSSISAAASAGTSPTSAWACANAARMVSQADVRPRSSNSACSSGVVQRWP